jgi:hypothetical protein
MLSLDEEFAIAVAAENRPGRMAASPHVSFLYVAAIGFELSRDAEKD